MRVQMLIEPGGVDPNSVVGHQGLPIELIDEYLTYQSIRDGSPIARANAPVINEVCQHLSHPKQSHGNPSRRRCTTFRRGDA